MTVTKKVKSRIICDLDNEGWSKWKEEKDDFQTVCKRYADKTKDYKTWGRIQVSNFFYDELGNQVAWDYGAIIVNGRIEKIE